MDDILILSILFVSTLINYYLQTYLYYKTIKLAKRITKKHLIFIVPLLTIFSIVVLVINNFVIFFVLPLVVLYPIVCMGGRLRERIFWGIVSCIILMFTNAISISIISSELLWQMETVSPIVFFIIDVIIVFLYWMLTLLVVHFNSKGRMYLPSKYWNGILMVTAILFSLFTLTFLLGNWFDVETSTRLVPIFTLALFAVFIVFYFVFYFVCKYFALSNEASLLATQNKMIEKFLQQKQTSDEQIKILSHDLKHSLVEWKSLAIEKNDINALLSIEEYEKQLADSSLVDVGNDSANAMINQKALEAHQSNISFVVDGFIYDDLVISKLELCALLGNLLDNALEAAIKVESNSLRKVKLSIKRKDGLMILIVENGYSVEPIRKNGVFLTTKNDKGFHSIGMVSIQRIVDKYHGTVTYSYSDNLFKAAVLLPCYQNALSNKC